MRQLSQTSKQIWCFGCNCMQNVCIHNECPQHYNMCDRINEIRLKASEEIPYD
jgi:hypothetical protein